jgi:hypothetical protein
MLKIINMNTTPNNIIYSDIKQELDTLLEIAPQNENLLNVVKATEYFKENKEALLVIRNGLRNINSEVLKVKKDEHSVLSETMKNILNSVDYNNI